MKKIFLAIFLAFCLILVACNTGTGTDPENTGDGTGTNSGTNSGTNEETTQAFTQDNIEKNPTASIGNAAANTVGAWVTDDIGISEIIVDTLKSGSVSMHLSGDTLFEQMGAMGLTSIDATLYTKEFADNMLEFNMTVGEETRPAKVWINSNSVAVSGALLFGDDSTAYKLSADALKDEEWLSKVAGVLSQYTDDIPSVEDINEMLNSTSENETVYTDMVTLMVNAVIDAVDGLEPEVKTEGKIVTLTYDITLEKIGNALKKAVNDAALTDEIAAAICNMIGAPEVMTAAELRAQLLESIDTLMASANESAEVDFKAKVSIDSETGKLTNMSVNILSDDTKVDFVSEFSDAGMKVTFDVDDDGTVVKASLELKKTVTDEAVEMSADLSLTSEGETGTIGLGVKYIKASGDLDVSMSTNIPGSEAATISVSGNISKTDKSATVKFDEICVEDTAIKFDLSITFTAGVEVPAQPSNAIDFKTLTEEELADLLESMGMSKTISGEYSREREDGLTETWEFYSGSAYVVLEGENSYAYGIGEFSLSGDNIIFNSSEIYFTSSDAEAAVLESIFNDVHTIEIGDGSVTIDGVVYNEVVHNEEY